MRLGRRAGVLARRSRPKRAVVEASSSTVPSPTYPDDYGARRPGRPTRLSPELQKWLTDLLRMGASIRMAAAACGLSEATVSRWRASGRTHAVACAGLDETDEHGRLVSQCELVHHIYAEFEAAVSRAQGEALLLLIALLQKASSNGSVGATTRV